MRVICIEKCTEYVGTMPYWYSPEVGDELNVLSVEEHYGRTFYDLEDYPEFLYDSNFFATLPDQPAEVIEEKEPEYATVEHPDRIPDWTATKTIQRGGMQALEDKAIAEYIKVFDERGKEEAEKVFFKHFNNNHGYQKS